MKNQSLLNQVQRQLRYSGLPKSYVQRYLQELEDHIEDVLEEQNMSTELLSPPDLSERLGEPSELADCVVKEYRRRNFFGRHPILCFLIGPIPFLVLLWLLSAAAMVGWMQAAPVLLGEAFQFENKTVQELPPFSLWLIMTFCYALPIVPPAIAAYVLCRLVVRSGRGWKWCLASSIIVALVAALFTCSFNLPYEPGAGKLNIGFGVSMQWHHVWQFMVPFLVGAAFCWFRVRARKADLSMV